jgi:RNA polymerase sigma-70 factor (ECF subfamily)
MASYDSPLSNDSGRWDRLLALVAPVHDRAAMTARRLTGSNHDGDDLLQESLLRAFDALPSLRDESRFAAWFYTILLSVHRNRSRRSFWKRFLPSDAGLDAGWEPAGDDGQRWEDERHEAERVSRALAGLPAEQREAVVLFELDGMSVEEIATLQDVSVSAVKSRLSRGRARLRRTYERWGFAGERAGKRSGILASAAAPALANVAAKEKRHE